MVKDALGNLSESSSFFPEVSNDADSSVLGASDTLKYILSSGPWGEDK